MADLSKAGEAINRLLELRRSVAIRTELVDALDELEEIVDKKPPPTSNKEPYQCWD